MQASLYDSYDYVPPAATSAPGRKPPRGSFESELSSCTTNRLWPNYQTYELWRKNEEEVGGFSFISCGSKRGEHYDSRTTYKCSRDKFGGEWTYRRTTDKKMKESSKIEGGCPCALHVRTYKDRPEVTGEYLKSHSHATGNANLQWLRVSKDARKGVPDMAYNGVSKEQALKAVRHGRFNVKEPKQDARLREWYQ